MRAWLYHLPIGQLGALGEMLGAAGFGFVLVAAVVIALAAPAAGSRAPAGAPRASSGSGFPIRRAASCSPLFGVAAVAIGRAPGPTTGPLARPLDWRLGVVLAGLVEYATPERWLIVPVGALGAAAAIGWRHLPAQARRPLRSLLPFGLAALAATAAVALTSGLERYRARDPGYAIGTGLDDAWAWFRVNVQRRARRLHRHEPRLSAGGARAREPGRPTSTSPAPPGDRLHDFGRRLPPPGRAATPESAPYRDGASFEVWLAQPARGGRGGAVRRGARRDRRPQRRRRRRRLPGRARLGRRPPRRCFTFATPRPDARVYGIAPP